jgi:YhcH/YjgK/YiaL family protein
MILDRIDQRKKYAGLGMSIPDALDYLAQTDFNTLPLGKQVIDGERLFAVVQRYQTKPVSDARWEMHRRYLDVQYIARGSERIGYVPWSESLPVQEVYDPERDVAFYEAAGVLLPVSAGMLAIFTPDEVHAPCLSPDEPEPAGEVLKVVVKCLWEK